MRLSIRHVVRPAPSSPDALDNEEDLFHAGSGDYQPILMTTCLPTVLVSDRSFRENKLLALPAGLFSGMPELRYLWVPWVIGWVQELSLHHSLRFISVVLVFIRIDFLIRFHRIRRGAYFFTGTTVGTCEAMSCV